MSGPRIIPSGPAVLREAITVLAGALLAALVIGRLPGVRAWIRAQWDGDGPSGPR